MKARLYFAAVLFFMRSRVCESLTQIPQISLNLHA